ncbi:TetR/AcrR family transcriptional regulator [Companilactobacillus nantensis]|uniref:Transcriptional regulator n=1 Tax=Companilactobacillus nantensis DSM 16982 TaxID=1423774 RepID=A0A0R1WM53_9LACO|nr:TetR/AcrR family transcriptional regulator C-terminal domain-containing protein [Companilactobacillus nantensis]KRM18573.1 transcriptional regulator [Companilactobacillus nantensis DSM 16982]GEO63241.1 TetR family transcriptional regulator [Companilactobacillus nantensis]
MQRKTKTNEKIKKAFIDLMKTKGFEHLSIRDITSIANINRSTFYAHYEDKYALVAHFEDTILEELNIKLKDNLDTTMQYQDVTQGVEPYTVLTTIMEYVASEFDLVKVLMASNGTSFEKRVKKILRHVIDQGLYLKKGNDKMASQIPNDYAYEIIVSGLMDTIKYWLSKDEPEDVNTIVDIIMKTRYLSPYDLLGVGDKN